MLYNLTEAYSEIYDHRKVEDLFDNLRFVDYLQDEDIQEVVEELVWEFRDYGNTLEESFDIIEYSLQDQVICESYEELVQDILYEATVTRSTRVPITSSTGRSSTPSTGSSKITLGRGGMETPSGASKVTSSNRFDQNEVIRIVNRIGRIRSQKQSLKSRISSLSGPISSVKQSISGSVGGIGRAAKAMGGKVVEKGKAILKSILRRGGKAVKNVGKSVEASGTRASQEAPKTTSVRVGKTTYSATKDPGGSKRQMVGRAIKRVGKALQKMSKGDKSKTTTQPTSSGPFQGPMSKTKPQGPKAPPAQGPRRPYENQNISTTKPQGPTSSTRRYPTETSGQTTMFTGPVKGKSTGVDVKVPPSGMKFGKTRKAKSPEKTRQTTLLNKLREDNVLDQILECITEDIIGAGYADTVNEAYDVIESLDNQTLNEMILEYIQE